MYDTPLATVVKDFGWNPERDDLLDPHRLDIHKLAYPERT